MFVFCLLLVIAAASAQQQEREPVPQPRTLVVLDTPERLQQHSAFLQTLRERQHRLSFALASDKKLSLFEHGEPKFENALIFTSDSLTLKVKEMTRFVDDGNNVMVVGDSIGKSLRQFAAQCGVSFGDTHVHGTAESRNFFREATIVGDEAVASDKPLLYSGVSLKVSDSPLLTEILTADAVAFTDNGDDKKKKVGTEIVLIAALQARNNARVLFSGSSSFFDNAAFANSYLLNKPVATALGIWACKERGYLRASRVLHQLLPMQGDETEFRGGGDDHQEDFSLVGVPIEQLGDRWRRNAPREDNPELYRVRDRVRFSLVVEEYDGYAQKWRPFVVSKDDVLQFELQRLDVFVRRDMVPLGEGRYGVHVRMPHHFGVFHAVVDHRRRGLSVLQVKRQMAVREFNHDEECG
ncbi:MAG: hypothetical protein MHM6MM_002593 [Cercozoa sp. M6MM]